MAHRGHPVLVCDTETTGFIQYTDAQKRSMRPLDQQPHVTQLAAVLYEEDGEELASMVAYVKPTNWTVPEEAAAVTGITTERLAHFGLPIRVVMTMWAHLMRVSDLIVAHNATFDMAMLQVECTRLGWGEIPKPNFCTMLTGTSICRIPHPKPRHEHDYKWPTLQQLHENLFQRRFAGAHDAMNDVRAAAACYFRMVELGLDGRPPSGRPAKEKEAAE